MEAGRCLVGFTGSNVILPGYDKPQPATIITDPNTGKIETVLSGQTVTLGPELDGLDIEWVAVEDRFFILPGLVDAHVHLNEPGRTDWEGFWTGTRAAASGGVTTIVDMPLNSMPPTTTLRHLEIKRLAAQGQCWTDVAFWGGVIPGNQSHLIALIEAGCKGFKCFLIESGVEEFPCVTELDLMESMKELQNESTVLLFHAELDRSPVPAESATFPDGEDDTNTSYHTFLSSRPQTLEIDAISLIIRLQAAHPSLRCHIVHLSASSALPLIQCARESGLNLTVETCFHYLCLSSDDIPHGRPEFKCCPPIRDQSNRELLWEALMNGVIECVVSDHSPCVADLKKLDTGDIMGAWGGISSLGLGLSLLWTEGRKRGVTVNQIVEWTSAKTAQHAGLGNVKGRLAAAYDADLIIWDPEVEWTVTKESLEFKNKISAFEGLTLRGRVEKTYVRGCMVYSRDKEEGGFANLKPIGKLL